MALDATAGGTNSNSYVTVDDANEYFETSLSGPDWDGIDEQEIALVSATEYLEAHVLWNDDKLTTEQALHFPSTDFPTIPVLIKRAVCLLAIHLNAVGVKGGTSLKSLSFGKVKIDIGEQSYDGSLPENVVSLISEFGSVRRYDGNISQAKIVRT